MMAPAHELHFTISDDGRQNTTESYDDPSLPNNAGAQPQQAGNAGIMSSLSQSTHPMVCVFHMLFKALALVLYLLGDKIVGNTNNGGNFVTLTVICILLLAFDFWTVKNITGRLLVGLRWWNKVEGETTRWIFECAENRAVNKFDESIFWTILYGAPVVWGVLFFFAAIRFKFNWLIIGGMGIGMSGANVYGYYKCSSDQKARFQQMMQRGAQQGAMSMISSGMLGFMTGASAQQQQQPQGAQPQSQQQFV